MADLPTLECEGVVRVYRTPTGETHALRGVDVAFRAGTLTAVAGPSGSGKSSLLRMLAVQELPSAGRLSVLGRDAATTSGRALRALRRRHVAVVEQRSARGLFAHLTAAEQVAQVAALRAVVVDPDRVLADVGLDHRAGHRPSALSGGEAQRLAVALALVGRPSIVVADEPTAELDHANTDVVLAALTRAAARGSTVVLATHDERVLAVAPRVLRLRHGVLSSEQAEQGDRLATIDASGRVQLPPPALALFPEGRAVLEVGDGTVVLRPPGEPR